MTTVDADARTSADFGYLLEQIGAAGASGDCEAGLVLCRRAEAVARLGNDPVAQAVALRERARFLTWLGELEPAIAACEEGRELLHGLDADRQWCDLAVAQSFALTGLGLGEDAMELLSEARRLAQQLGDRALLYWVHNRTGLAYDSFGDHRTARELLEQALALADAVDAQGRWSIMTNLVHNAMSFIPELLRTGAEADAARILHEALEHAEWTVRHSRAENRPYELALSLGNLGAVQQLAGRPEQALATLEQARELAAEHDYRPLRMSALQHMPGALLDLGRHAEAMALLCDVLQQSIELGELPVQVEVLNRLADLHEQQGDFRQALLRFRAYHSVEQQLRSGRALTRARLLAHQAHLEQARIEAEEARARNEELLSDRQALLDQTVELERRAHSDALTGLANRRYVDAALPALYAQARSGERELFVAVLDVDHFKSVNDTFGHAVGDEVLVRLGELMRTACRPDDLLARHGGEEFLLAMADLDRSLAVEVCERIRLRIAEHDWTAVRPQLQVTVSIGLSSTAGTIDHVDSVRAADRQLYRAKESGRNRTCTDC